MSLNKLLVKGRMSDVNKLRMKGKVWKGPRDSYKKKRLTSLTFKFPNDVNKLADLLLTVLDLNLVDINDGVDGVSWQWFITIDKPCTFKHTDPAEFITCYDTYVIADGKVVIEDEMSRPQIKVSFDENSSLYRFIVEQYNEKHDTIAYNKCFNRQDAITLLSRLNICENKPYSC